MPAWSPPQAHTPMHIHSDAQSQTHAHAGACVRTNACIDTRARISCDLVRTNAHSDLHACDRISCDLVQADMHSCAASTCLCPFLNGERNRMPSLAGAACSHVHLLRLSQWQSFLGPL
eukprot:6176629-Pleurochrysis_carterae.AAC.2